MDQKNLANTNHDKETVLGLRNEVKTLLGENAILLEQNQRLTIENQRLRENVASLRHKLFGKKTDKVKRSISNKHNKKNKSDPLNKPGRKPKNKDIAVDTTINYTFDKLICSDCNGALRYIGSNDSTHIEHKAIIKNIKISKSKYICTCCQKITVANGAKLPIRKGAPMPGLLTKVVLDKFGNAIPAYRQAQNYSYCDLNYSRQMICNWHMRGSDLLSPLGKLIFKKILQSQYLGIDETNIILLKISDKAGSVAYICCIRQGGEKFNFVYYWVIESRQQKIISEKLKDFKGYLQTDGLNFYFDLEKQEGVIAIDCWAHVQRKFVEIVNLSNNHEGIASHVVNQIEQLYAIEKKGKPLELEQLAKLRRIEAKPILAGLKTYLQENQPLVPPKSKLGIAIKYTLTRWEALNNYINNPLIDIDNNATERCIKYIVIGRKNWLFAHDIESANNLALLYSLIVSCKFNNINPKGYLEYVFTQMPYINKHDEKELEQLLPDRFDVNKRFDQEYRRKLGIVETIIEHSTPLHNKMAS